MRVLVLDDDPLFRSATARTLRRFRPEVQVTLAATSTEARLRLREHQHDAMLLDLFLSMEDEDRTGMVFLRREREGGSKIPALLVSAADVDLLERSAREAGAQGWLSKSDLSSLRAGLESLLDSRRDGAAVSDLPDSLKPLVEHVRRLIDERGSARAAEDARVAHAIALLARCALQADSSTGSVVRSCARAIDIERNTLSAYAPLALWSVERLTAFLERKNVAGDYLTVSHALLLAPLSSASTTPIIEHIVANSTSVRGLKRLLLARRGGAGARRGRSRSK